MNNVLYIKFIFEGKIIQEFAQIISPNDYVQFLFKVNPFVPLGAWGSRFTFAGSLLVCLGRSGGEGEAVLDMAS